MLRGVAQLSQNFRILNDGNKPRTGTEGTNLIQTLLREQPGHIEVHNRPAPRLQGFCDSIPAPDPAFLVTAEQLPLPLAPAMSLHD
jgi:hypothetical protein